MDSPCYKCKKRNPPCHDSCNKFKDYRSSIEKSKANELKFRNERMIVVESTLRKMNS